MAKPEGVGYSIQRLTHGQYIREVPRQALTDRFAMSVAGRVASLPNRVGGEAAMELQAVELQVRVTTANSPTDLLNYGSSTFWFAIGF